MVVLQALVCILKERFYYIWGHIKTLLYKTKVDSRAALRLLIFAAAKQIKNNPHNIACATGSLKIRAANCIAAGGGHFKQVL